MLSVFVLVFALAACYLGIAHILIYLFEPSTFHTRSMSLPSLTKTDPTTETTITTKQYQLAISALRIAHATFAKLAHKEKNPEVEKMLRAQALEMQTLAHVWEFAMHERAKEAPPAPQQRPQDQEAGAQAPNTSAAENASPTSPQASQQEVAVVLYTFGADMMLRPCTDAARAWCKEHMPPTARKMRGTGEAYLLALKWTPDVILGMEAAGLSVVHDFIREDGTPVKEPLCE